MLYFKTVENILENAHRILVLHETNVKNENEEVYFLLVNKDNVSDEVSDLFKTISLKSMLSLDTLSPASQLYILKNNFYHIHLVTMVKGSPSELKEDVENFKKNMSSVLIELYPEIKDRLDLELEKKLKYAKQNKEDFKYDNGVTEEQSFLEFVQKNGQEILSGVTQDTQQAIKKAQNFLQNAKNDLKPDIEEGVNQIKSNIPVLKEKLQNKSENILHGLSKKFKAIKKMK